MFPALAIIAASMAAKYMANQDAADRQAQLARSMQAYQLTKARENQQAISNLTQTQTPDARAKQLADIQASRQQTMQGTVDQQRSAAPVTVSAGSTASKDYQDASAAAADTIANRTKRAIAQLGVMGAPGEDRLMNAIRFGRTAGTVDANNQAISNVGNAYMTDINNVRPNPFLTMAGDVGLGVGTGMAFGGAGGGAQPNLVSGGSQEWGGLDAGPGAYNANYTPSIRARLAGALRNWGS